MRPDSGRSGTGGRPPRIERRRSELLRLWRGGGFCGDRRRLCQPSQCRGQCATFCGLALAHPGQRVEIHAAFDFGNDAVPQRVER
jgi:hypothetical protein